MFGGAGNRIYQYSFGTPGNVTTLSYDSKSYAPPQFTGGREIRSIFINKTGTKLYVSGDVYGTQQYYMTVDNNISTAVPNYKHYPATFAVMFANINLKKLFVGDNTIRYWEFETKEEIETLFSPGEFLEFSGTANISINYAND